MRRGLGWTWRIEDIFNNKDESECLNPYCCKSIVIDTLIGSANHVLTQPTLPCTWKHLKIFENILDICQFQYVFFSLLLFNWIHCLSLSRIIYYILMLSKHKHVCVPPIRSSDPLPPLGVSLNMVWRCPLPTNTVCINPVLMVNRLSLPCLPWSASYL